LLNLLTGVRPDERFHLQTGPPVPHVVRLLGLRRTEWTNLILPDGAPATFISWWLWKLQWYHGTAKCDGTRTRMGWSVELGDPTAPNQYVITTTPSEMHAFRWRSNGPGEPIWSNMGGA